MDWSTVVKKQPDLTRTGVHLIENGQNSPLLTQSYTNPCNFSRLFLEEPSAKDR